MILIVSHPDDVHAQAVLRELDALGAPARLLNLSDFPQRAALAIGYNGRSAPRYTLSLPDGPLDLAACGAVWWRRPQPYKVHDEVEAENLRAFAYNEATEAFTGLWQCLDAFWINHPTRDHEAHRKVYQLRLAREAGLTTPQTLITNDPGAARAFVAQRGPDRTIYKAFSATARDWRETRLLRADALAAMDSVKYAPVIFQEYVEATVDLRATVVGDEVFTGAIHSQETSYPVDFRMDMDGARIEPHAMPESVRERLLALVRRLGLVYGACDFRLTPEGEYVFLEVNPAGQWLFVEERTGQPIARAIAARLAEHDGVAA